MQSQSIVRQFIAICIRVSVVLILLLDTAHGYEAPAVGANSTTGKTEATVACEHTRLFVFSWLFRDSCNMSPRGGTTKGNRITLDPETHAGWLAVQQPGLSDFERDRQAILAMAGPYRTSFNFIETVGYSKNFAPDKPYQSWGTEYVYVVEDRRDFISLQHIMVMFIEQNGELTGPLVMKHWRQDWQYEKRKLLAYAGHNRWEKTSLSRKQRKKTWAQAVYEVDDSPRYESFGRWEHKRGLSTWVSAPTWRPLPRRERSVRKDYHILEGINRHSIVPTGWVHEEENYKVVLGEGPISEDSSKPAVPSLNYLAKEQGVNRYERIIDHDFSAGERYWQRSGLYWQHVREAWSTLIEQRPSLSLVNAVDGLPLFVPLFEYAETLQQQPYDADAGKDFILATITRYIKPDGE